MREICRSEIAAAAERLYKRAATMLPPDLAMALECAYATESEERARLALRRMTEDFKSAARDGRTLREAENAAAFCVAGRDVCVSDGDIKDAVADGISRVCGAPPEVFVRRTEGERIVLTVAFGGFESEIKRIFGTEEAESFIVEAAKRAAYRVSPPLVVGAGMGKSAAEAEKKAKIALYRPADTENPDSNYARTERRTLNKINALRIGAGGFGGKNTALSVNIEASGAPDFCAVCVSDHIVCRACAEI